MSKTLKLLNEIKTYLDPSLSCESLFDWFKNNVIIKDPVLYFDCRPESDIIYVRQKRTGKIVSKFRIECLDRIDDDLSFEEEDEENSDIEIQMNPNDIDQLTNAINNKEKLQAAGMGQVSDNATKALNMYGKAMDQVIANTTETAQKILSGNK